MLKKFNGRRGCTVPRPLTSSSTKKSDGAEKFVMTGSMDGCSVLQETQFVRTHLRMDTTWVLSVGGFLLPLGNVGERPEFDKMPPLGAPLLIYVHNNVSVQIYSTFVVGKKNY